MDVSSNSSGEGGFTATATSKTAVSMDFRIDGRHKSMLRPMKVDKYSGSDTLSNSIWAAGSAMASNKLSLGELYVTSVACAVHGPAQPRYPRNENYEELCVEAEICFVGDRDIARQVDNSKRKLEKNYGSFIKTILKSCIDTKRYPRQLLVVKLDVFSAQGGSLAAAINAAILALMDAGVSLLNVPVATSIAVIENSSSNNSSSNSSSSSNSNSDSRYEIFIDPILEEEKIACIVGTVVTVPSRAAGRAIIGGVESSEDVLCSNLIGNGADPGIFSDVLDKASRSACMTRNFFRSLFDEE